MAVPCRPMLLVVCMAIACAPAFAGRIVGGESGFEPVEVDPRPLDLPAFKPGEWPPTSWPYDFWDPEDSVKRELSLYEGAPGRDDLWSKWLAYVQQRAVRNYTVDGYKVRAAPPEIRDELYRYAQENMGTKMEVFEDFAKNKASAINGNEVLPSFLELRNKREIAERLRPLHEEWCNCKLKFVAAYGMRIYHNGNTLQQHVDRVDTHVISSIFHVAHDLLDPWPMVVLNMYGKEVEVNQKPGELLHYESSKIFHGRPKNFRGKYYVNIFFHYTPLDWEWGTPTLVKLVPKHWIKKPDDLEGHMAESVKKMREGRTERGKTDPRWLDWRLDPTVAARNAELESVLGHTAGVRAGESGGEQEEAAGKGAPDIEGRVVARDPSEDLLLATGGVPGEASAAVHGRKRGRFGRASSDGVGPSERETINSATEEMYVFMGAMLMAMLAMVGMMAARACRGAAATRGRGPAKR